MSKDARTERAIRWLSEQIEQLKSLRNAKTRDHEFKQWRQTTLTIVQRIWPGDSRRSARFRRIPFSPPSTQADGREIREHYERGCAEAAQLLGAFLDEVNTEGLPAEGNASKPASFNPGGEDDDETMIDLSAGPAKPATDAAEVPAAGESPSDAVNVRGRNGAGDGNHGSRVERRKRLKKGGHRRRLRDMLGLDALEKLTGNSDDAREPEIVAKSKEDSRDEVAGAGERQTPAAGSSDAPPPVLSDGDPVGDDEDAVGVEAESKAAVESVDQSSDDPFGRDQKTDVQPDDAADPGDDIRDDETNPLSADDFLSASPVFKSSGRPVRRAKRDAPAPAPLEADFTPSPLTSSSAIAVAAIAAEVARLGVPEGHRARTRASLISLSEQLEEGDLDWDALRRAVAFAMEFPPVGRRLLPLLISFLDRAA